MRKQRVVLALEPSDAEMLEQLAGGSHKKSNLIARLLHQAAEPPRVEPDPLCAVEERLAEVERKIDLLLARLS